jgi:hypothetical protein
LNNYIATNHLLFEVSREKELEEYILTDDPQKLGDYHRKSRIQFRALLDRISPKRRLKIPPTVIIEDDIEWCDYCVSIRADVFDQVLDYVEDVMKKMIEYPRQTTVRQRWCSDAPPVKQDLPNSKVQIQNDKLD